MRDRFPLVRLQMSGVDEFYPIAGCLASAQWSAGIRDMRKKARLSGDFLFDMLMT